jgi:tol-pal system protein YbgF
VRNVTRLLVLALAASPVSVPAQNKNDLASMQRDIADLEDKIRQLQKSEEEKNAALTALVQQAVDASSRVSANLVTLQKNLTDSVNASLISGMKDQQSKVVEPMAILKTRLDEVAQEVGAAQNTISDLSLKFAKFDDRLKDIYTAVTTQPIQPPPAAGGAPPPTANGAPPGVTAVSLQQSAEQDFSSAKYKLALDEFADFIKYFPDYAYAPVAQYHIGEIYERGEQWDDAAKAFDAVVERFPKNEKTVDAAYYKAVMLQKGGHKAEAKEEYKNFLSDYPTSEHARMARQNLNALEGVSSKAGNKKK